MKNNKFTKGNKVVLKEGSTDFHDMFEGQLDGVIGTIVRYVKSGWDEGCYVVKYSEFGNVTIFETDLELVLEPVSN